MKPRDLIEWCGPGCYLGCRGIACKPEHVMHVDIQAHLAGRRAEDPSMHYRCPAWSLPPDPLDEMGGEG